MVSLLTILCYLISSNRTFMELKFWKSDNKRSFALGSNRTFMELKYAQQRCEHSRYQF